MPPKCINGRTYYYVSRREGDRVVSCYLGAGAAAELVDRLLGIERDRRRRARRDEQGRLRALAAADRPLAGYFRAVQAVFLAAMDCGGFHRHERGPWRRRRTMATATETTTEAPAPRSYSHADMNEIMMRGANGDASALPEIRALLESDWGPRLIEVTGSPEVYLSEELIASIAGKGNLSTAEAMRRKLEALRRQLTPEGSGPLERLLAGRVAVCWLAANAAELTAASRAGSGAATPRESEYLDRRADRAHRRLLASVKALAALRMPGVGVGVAVQVNVGAGGPTHSLPAGAAAPGPDDG